MNHNNLINRINSTTLLIFCAAVSVFSSTAKAESSHCYNIPMANSPMAESNASPRSEAWCYERTNDPKGMYIYNIDDDMVKPELALLVDEQGIITHASLIQDKITYHKVASSEFNPFSVPLKEPTQLSQVPESYAANYQASAKEVLENLRHAEISTIATKDTFRISDNEVQPFASASFQPWRGYWWPYRNFPLSGPLSRYDSFVQNRTGINPGTHSWESSHHFYKGISWEGHCNGWAASAILRSEPKSTHSGNGISFSVSDIKGLLAEKDYCANVAFFGTRYNGSGNISDIAPALFHRTLVYYIKTLRKPVAMDYKRDAPVDNHIASAYSMTLTRINYNTFDVVANLTMHKYDSSRINTPGIAPTYTRTYHYRLVVDSSGNPISGTWISTNPDFLWVPLSPTTCNGNNPRVSGNWVDVIRNM